MADAFDRYQELDFLLAQVLEREPQDRPAFLDQACGGDKELRRKLERLIAGAESPELTPLGMSEGSLGPPALEPGQRLGAFEIVEAIGAGGMGEVYRARDTRLEREVAVKVLPPDLSAKEAFRERFQREARAISGLNHPNICVLHDVGYDDGHHYLVMELLEGETLQEVLARGRVPVQRAVEIAIQIARALTSVHAVGVVHRDLKPGNVFVTSEGAKLLDFGLAKVDPVSIGDGEPTRRTLTAEGAILGTLHYMTPEQLDSRPVDARTDIFAFGCLLYELLTGQRAFDGETPARVVSAILNEVPARLSERMEVAPPLLDRLVERALAKAPGDRWQSMSDLCAQLEWIAAGDGDPGALSSLLAQEAASSRASRGQLALAGLALALAALGLAWAMSRALTPEPVTDVLAESQVERLTVSPRLERRPTLSPDGEFFVYSAESDGGAGPSTWSLYLQRVDGERPIQITDDATDDYVAAFSPDGGTIALCSEDSGLAVELLGTTGESRRRVLDDRCWPAWSPDGRYLASSNGHVYSDPAALGTREDGRLSILEIDTGAVTELDVTGLTGIFEPSWSPDGRSLVFWTIEKDSHHRDLWTQDLDSSNLTQLTDDPAVDFAPQWVAPRAIYFLSDRGGTRNAWQLDPETGEVRAFTLPSSQLASLSFAADGQRVLFSSYQTLNRIVKTPFSATEGPLGPPETLAVGPNFMLARSSPDSREVVFLSTGPKPDLFLVGMDGSNLRRLTSDRFIDRWPTWSPDGHWVTFFSDRGGRYDVWVIRPDGTGLARLAEGYNQEWSPDGSWLMVKHAEGGPFLLPVLERGSAVAPPRLGKRVGVPRCDGSRFNAAKFTTDSQQLVGRCDGDTEIQLLNIETGTFTTTGFSGNGALNFLAPGQLLRTAGAEGEVYDLDSGTSLWKGPLATVGSTGVSSDGKSILRIQVQEDGDVWAVDLRRPLAGAGAGD